MGGKGAWGACLDFEPYLFSLSFLLLVLFVFAPTSLSPMCLLPALQGVGMGIMYSCKYESSGHFSKSVCTEEASSFLFSLTVPPLFHVNACMSEYWYPGVV